MNSLETQGGQKEGGEGSEDRVEMEKKKHEEYSDKQHRAENISKLTRHAMKIQPAHRPPKPLAKPHCSLFARPHVRVPHDAAERFVEVECEFLGAPCALVVF